MSRATADRINKHVSEITVPKGGNSVAYQRRRRCSNVLHGAAEPRLFARRRQRAAAALGFHARQLRQNHGSAKEADKNRTSRDGCTCWSLGISTDRSQNASSLCETLQEEEIASDSKRHRQVTSLATVGASHRTQQRACCTPVTTQ